MAAFSLFFNSNFSFFEFMFFSAIPFFTAKSILLARSFINIDFVFDKIRLDFESLYFVGLNKFSLAFNSKLINVFFFFLNKKISYSYNFLICKKLQQFAFEKEGKKNLSLSDQSILGFKIHISGRLSRKDRASDI